MIDLEPVLLYDGDCGLCTRSVQFVLDHNGANSISFATLQSSIAAELCEPFDIDTTDLSSLVFIDAGKSYRMSDASAQIATHLDRPWSLGAYLRFVPRVVRDAGYRLVAGNRTRLGFSKDACRIPTPAERARFLDL